jgi:hypothetical protein
VHRQTTQASATRVSAADWRRVVALMAYIGGALTRGEAVDSMLQGRVEALVRHRSAAVARVWLCEPDAGVLQLWASAGSYTRLDGTPSRIRTA